MITPLEQLLQKECPFEPWMAEMGVRRRFV